MGEKNGTLTSMWLEVATKTEPARSEAVSADGHRRVELDSSLPEVELLAEALLQIFNNSESFIDRKESSQLNDKKAGAETEDEAWAREISWRLLPNDQFRFGGLLPEFHAQREEYVRKQMGADQPMQFDLQTIWVDNISAEHLQLADLTTVENMVGLAKILQYYRGHNVDEVKGAITLRFAIEPNSLNPPSLSEFTNYVAKLNELLVNCAAAAKIDTSAISLNIQSLPESIATNSQEADEGLETEITTLTHQIERYWEENQAIFTDYLREKRQLANNANLTWDEVAKGGWKMHNQGTPVNQNRDADYYFRLSIKKICEDKLFALSSWKTIPPEYQAQLGWLTPRAKLDLLADLISDASVSTFTAEDVPTKGPAVEKAARLLATKLVIQQHQTTDTPLKFQFGQPLPDAPLNNLVRLRVLGNLTYDRKQKPWRQPQMMSYRQGAYQIAEEEPTDKKTKQTTPQQLGFNLVAEKEGLVDLKTIAIIKVGKSRVEVPFNFIPHDWLKKFVKAVMEGDRHD